MIDISERYLSGECAGWKFDPVHSKDYLARSSTPIFCVAADDIMDAMVPVNVFLPRYLYMAIKARYNAGYFPQWQDAGTCVGQSHKSLADTLMAINWAISGVPFEGRASVAAIYTASRVEIGKSPGSWDGSTGSWASEALTKLGVGLIPEMGMTESYTSKDDFYRLTSEDERKATSWTARREGIPEEYEKLARARPVEGSALVTQVAEIVASIGSLNPVNLCGTVHPSKTRNSQGISKLSSGGGHSTWLCGYYVEGISPGRYMRVSEIIERHIDKLRFDHMNSWGSYYTGPWARGGHEVDKLFAAAVTAVTAKDVTSWLRARDSYSFWGIHGLNTVDKKFFV